MLQDTNHALDAMTVNEAVAVGVARLHAAGIASARLDAELLLAASLDKDRTWLAAHARVRVPEVAVPAYERLLSRRSAREPLSYILGRQEFWSLDFVVTPDVLIPRPETELLIELALQEARRSSALESLRVADVGTGSGCIAITLATELRTASFFATDVSEAALKIAEHNARRLAVDKRVRFIRGDLLDTVEGDFNLIVSNPPYVGHAEEDQLQPELRYEPAGALFAGADGLAVIRRLVEQAACRLTPGGVLLMEIGAGQAAAVRDLAISAGFHAAGIKNDLAGLPRVLVAGK